MNKFLAAALFAIMPFFTVFSAYAQNTKAKAVPEITNAVVAKPAANNTQADWTVMIFSASNNNLYQSLYQDVAEMEKATLSPKVNVVLQVGTSDPSCQNQGVSALRYKLRGQPLVKNCSGNDPYNPEKLPGASMGSIEDLLDFILASVEDYPAKRYAFILSGHGYGAKDMMGAGGNGKAERSIAPDQATGRIISTAQIAAIGEAVKQLTGKNLDVLAFDACSMQSMEVLKYVAGNTDIIVASQSPVPTTGFKYDSLLSRVAANPPQNPETFANIIFDTYQNSEAAGHGTTLSVIRLSQFETAAKMLDQWAAAVANPQNIERWAKAYQADRSNGAINMSPPELVAVYKGALYNESTAIGSYEATIFHENFTETQESVDVYKYLESIYQSDTLKFEKYAPPLARMTKQLMDYIENALVAQSMATGSYSHAKGISVYMMHNPVYYADYDKEAFAKQHCWSNYLKWLLFENPMQGFSCRRAQ